ncbi:MAG TPA: hypothetical protein VF183_00505 [Acidimicrobiales bacterium]
MAYELVDPRGEVAQHEAAQLALRAGKVPPRPRIGFLVNEVSRQTGPDFMAYTLVLEELLRERIGELDVHRDAKPVLSRPAELAMLEQYRDCRGVVSGLAK